MKIVSVVAASENNVIGIHNEIPWHLPDDLKFFKNNTLDHPIIMGKNTWLSLGAQPLPRRLNIVISRSLTAPTENDFMVCRSIDEALLHLENNYEFKDEAASVCIIGGGQLYQSTMHITDEIFMTRVHKNIENGMAFFPEIRQGGWKKVWESYHGKDERHDIDFTFERWEAIR